MTLRLGGAATVQRVPGGGPELPARDRTARPSRRIPPPVWPERDEPSRSTGIEPLLGMANLAAAAARSTRPTSSMRFTVAVEPGQHEDDGGGVPGLMGVAMVTGNGNGPFAGVGGAESRTTPASDHATEDPDVSADSDGVPASTVGRGGDPGPRVLPGEYLG